MPDIGLGSALTVFLDLIVSYPWFEMYSNVRLKRVPISRFSGSFSTTVLREWFAKVTGHLRQISILPEISRIEV